MPQVKSEYDDLDKYRFVGGNIYYFKKNTRILHNPYGPAIVNADGSKQYYIENLRHRLDGPAITHPSGLELYFINSKELTKEEFEMHPERLKYLNKEYLLCLI